jgi:hypothetical protein
VAEETRGEHGSGEEGSGKAGYDPAESGGPCHASAPYQRQDGIPQSRCYVGPIAHPHGWCTKSSMEMCMFLRASCSSF